MLRILIIFLIAPFSIIFISLGNQSNSKVGSTVDKTITTSTNINSSNQQEVGISNSRIVNYQKDHFDIKAIFLGFNSYLSENNSLSL